ADVSEGANNAARTTGQIWARILDERAGKATGDWSASDVTALDTAAPDIIGAFFDAETPIVDALDQVAGSVWAPWWVDKNGIYRIQQFTAPSGSPVARFTQFDLRSAPERIRTSDEGRGLPTWRSILRYQKNYTVQKSGLAGATLTDRRTFLAEE